MALNGFILPPIFIEPSTNGIATTRRSTTSIRVPINQNAHETDIKPRLKTIRRRTYRNLGDYQTGSVVCGLLQRGLGRSSRNAQTDAAPEFETQSVPSGTNTIHSDTHPV